MAALQPPGERGPRGGCLARDEAIYATTPLYGLAAATSSVPALGRRETAARRLGFHDEPAVAPPPV